MPDLSTILIALGLTIVAGLSTGIGALISFFTKSTDTRMLAGALGLSAGVMVYISFMELMPEAVSGLATVFSDRVAEAYMLLAFFGGIALIAVIDYFVPEDENPHEPHTLAELNTGSHHHHLKRTGTMLAVAIGIHNFPEGMATFISCLDGLEVALPIVIAIAIHNIPEGIAVSVPIYHSTGDRRKALRLSLLSGLAEPVGALVGMAFLLPFWSPVVNAICLAIVAGIMVYIAFDELLPGAESFGHHHISLIGVITGMALMALTLLIL
ncbi:MAG: zinc transporter ZupT [Staphylococcus sp.]|nr:zinc transporter ZupT [Staphylococcus sp.]